MMLEKLWELFLAFLISNLLGYGGGPATIPLIQEEVVHHYGWLDNMGFSNLLALGNSLPGPITTNIATYVGFQVGGWVGILIALAATIVPSALALILLQRLLERYRQSSVIKGMTVLVQPVIAVLMLTLTWEMGRESVAHIGIWQSALIAGIALFAMGKGKVHPAFVILGAFLYGGLVLPYFM